jgi:hypothetical protein
MAATHHPAKEHRRLGPNAEGQRKHGHDLSAVAALRRPDREAGVLQQWAEGEFQVVHDQPTIAGSRYARCRRMSQPLAIDSV